MKSKKGVDAIYSNIAIVIALAAVAVVLLLWVGKVYAGTDDTKDRLACRSTVSAQAVTLNPIKDLVDPDCPTYNIKFYNNRVEKNTKAINVYDIRSGTVTKKFDGLSDDIVNRVLAEELRLCWWQFLEGKKSIWSISFFFRNDGQTCYICDEVLFDESVNNQLSFKKFLEFTQKTKISNSDQTYYQYFAEQQRLYDQSVYGTNPKVVWDKFADGRVKKFIGIDFLEKDRPPITKDVVFNKNEVYFVVFMREGEAMEKYFRGEGKNAPPDEVKETYFSYVLSSKELMEQCTSKKRGVNK
ncbi:hypothetical protein JW826_02630 [Candidatus Woesearchaeota archaeon]|nr:hypothetical protein [Candidatus Woesearchaeota archaeon]